MQLEITKFKLIKFMIGDIKMKRIISFILALALTLLVSSPIFASSNASKDAETVKSERATFELVVKNNELVKKYLTDEDIQFYRNIIDIKEKNSSLDAKDIIPLIEPSNSLAAAESDIPSEQRSFWGLTYAEWLLVILYPVEALKVNACKESTDNWTETFYPYWVDGDEGNAYRHTFWNALMASEIGVMLAQDFATAHENHGLTDAEYEAIIMDDGFTALDHRQMDLHNNYMGRSEAYPNNGETDIHYKVMDLIDDDQLTILH